MRGRFCAWLFMALVLVGLTEIVSAKYAFDDHGKNPFDDDVDSYNNTLDMIGLRFNIYDGYLSVLKTVMQQDSNVMYSDANVKNNVLYVQISPRSGDSHTIQGIIALAFAGFVQAVNLTDVNSLIFTRVDKTTGTAISTFHASEALAQDALNSRNNSTEIAIDLQKFADTIS